MSGRRILLLKCLLFGLFTILTAAADPSTSNGPPTLHFPLYKRGGPFAPNRTADLDFLKEQLHFAEGRFNLTQREVKGNRVVRAPKENDGGAEASELIGEIGRLGNWCVLRSIA